MATEARDLNGIIGALDWAACVGCGHDTAEGCAIAGETWEDELVIDAEAGVIICGARIEGEE